MKMHTMFRMSIPALAGFAAAAAAQTGTRTPLSVPIPGQFAQSHARVALETVVSDLVSPVAAAVAPGDRRHLYVTDQAAFRVFGCA